MCAALATFIYAKLPCSNLRWSITRSFLPQIGEPRKNEKSNKFDSRMLKFKSQVTLFVNHSYNSFYDLRSSEKWYSEQVMCPNIFGFFKIIWALYMNIPLTDIHASDPPIFILYKWLIALVVAKFTCWKSFETINYSMRKMYCKNNS